MPTTLPPIPSDQWDQHVETTSQERYASDLASIDRARAAQQQAEAHRVANDARDEADAQQRASAQIEAIGIAQSRNQEEVDAQRQAAAQIDAIRPPEMPQAPAPQPSSAPTDVGGTDWRAYAAQAAQRAGIDPGMFQRQIQQESGFDPNARSGAGAQGIAQIVPSAHPGVNPLDPKASLDYAANWMRSLVDRYGGDARKALAAYNAGPGAVDKYGGVPPFEETQRYVRTIYDEGQQQASPLEPPTTPGAQSSQYATARAPGRVEAVGQFEQGLPYEEAVAICGPVAALAFAKANGRNPDLAEVRALATGRGWTSTGGMNGIANEQATLTDLGVKSRLDPNPDFGHIAQDAASGNPVIISTPVHYYYANNYDPATGKIFVGKTGTSRKGGGSWMTPQEIATLDGGINGALFVDNPQSPTPSVGADPMASGEGDRPASEFETPPPQEIPRRLGPESVAPTDLSRIGIDVGVPGPSEVRAAARRGAETVGGAIDWAGAGLVDNVQKFTADQEELARLSLDRARAAHRGETLPPEDEQRLTELSMSYGLPMTGEPLAAVNQAGRAALGLERAAATRQPGMSLETTGGPGGPVERLQSAVDAAVGGAAGQVERLRLDKVPEEAQATVQQAAERGDYWLQQRRNVISDAEAERMADELGRTADQMIAGGRIGRAYNSEELRALKNGLIGQALKVDDLKATVAALGDQASDALRHDLGREEATLLALSRVFEGGRAEAGRAFRAFLMDGRSRLLRARGPEYTNVSRVPIRPAPELGPGVEQAGFVRDPELHRPPVDPGPAAPELVGRVEQATPFGSTDYYREPVAPGPRAAPAPGSATPRVTEQPPLVTEPVATTGKATNLIGETRTVGAGRMSVYDRASLVRMAGMVSAVPTHLLNIAGNTVMGGLTLGSKQAQVGADLARVGIGRALGRDVERQRFQAEVGPQLAGYGRGLWAGLQQVGGILAHGAPQTFHAAHGTRGFGSRSAALNTAVELPLRALAASDAVFRGAAFGGHAAALATRQATQEGLSGAARSRRVQEILGNLSDYPGLLDGANKLAARDVFQEARLETDAISRFKQQHVGAKVAGDVFLPFYKTPYNVAAQGAGMTPAGYLGALAAARRGETGEAVDRAVRATVGTGAMAVGFQLATSGLLTGAYPATPSERSTLPEGWKPYSLRIPSGDGAVYVPIQSLGALAVPLGVAAIMHDANQRGIEKDDPMKAVYAGVGGIGQFMGDMSALQGLNAISKLVTEPERTVESFTESLGASFVPGSGFARQIQQALGDAQRDPAGPVEAFMAGVPGLSQFVPTKLTSLGDPRARGPSGWLAFLGGGRIGVERDEPVLAAYREAGASLGAPGSSVIGHEITPEEQRRVQTRSGELLRERVAEWATDPDFRALPADERADILDRARSQAREDAGIEILDPLSDDELARRRAQHALKRPA